jgi:LysR family transcriptional regulator, glycine cleavage system transcriptional activator
MIRLSMSPRFPPLPWLRAFEASARHLSFTDAATELHLTQAAISKQVKLLEHFLREPLFHRKPRSLVLTKIGAAYLPKVRDAFERLAGGTEEVFGNRRSEMLCLRAPAAFSVHWLAARLPGFYRQHPETPLRLVSSVWNEEFDKERFDLDIRYGDGRWPGFHSDQLTWESLVPVCAPSVAAQMHTPADIAHQPLLHVLGYEEGWAAWLRAAGVTGVSPGAGHQFDSSALAFQVAAQGFGVALGRTSMTAQEIASGRLVAPFALQVPVREAFHMIAPLDGREHPDAARFRRWILAEAAAARPRENLT